MNPSENAPEGSHTAPGNTIGTAGEQTDTSRTSRNVSPFVLQPTKQERRILEQLECVIDDYRCEQQNKVESITRIVDIVSGSELDSSFRSDAIEHNIALINSIQKEATRRSRCAAEREEIERERDRTGGADRRNFVEQDEPETRPSKSGICRETLASTQTQRNRLARDGSCGSSESDSDDEGPSTKRRKVREDELLWFHEEKASRESEDVRCQENRKTLEIYLRNPSYIRRQISVSRIAPSNFPGSEWDKLIKGELTDFDAILSAIHHIGAPRENRGSFGNCEIVLGYSDPI
ncbi:hypothetical protein C0992_004570 [Termitomyces sp. T32_za158]|nr:hypothetical protein C0992_004570 [Termitomyces sp. T32_za158]